MVTWNKAARARGGDPLTRRDLDIHALLAAGDPTRVIADRFGITPGTVTTHLIGVCTKIGAQTAVEAAALPRPPCRTTAPGGGRWPDKPRQRRAGRRGVDRPAIDHPQPSCAAASNAGAHHRIPDGLHASGL
jgi:DNA-binding CsgD family transcriptional regulator